MIGDSLFLLLFTNPGGAPPLGLEWYRPAPAANPLTTEKVALGRQLFFDKRLSRDRPVACSGCHDPKRAFKDGREVAVGVKGRRGARNTPALINRVYGASFFLDGRAPALERQVLEPILHPREMRLRRAEIRERTGSSERTSLLGTPYQPG